MNKAVSVLTMALIAGIASADIAVDFKNNGDLVYEAGSSTVFVDQALVQLIWTASVPSQQAGVGGTLGDGEQLLYSILTTSGFAGTWSDQYPGILEFVDTDVGGADINAGYFFVRTFDNSALGLGDYYLQQYQQGPVLAEYNTEPAPAPYSTFQELGGSLDAQGNQVIPEPAVAALIGIFGGGMLISRRIFSRS